jgi:hypothetical protein
VFVECKRLGAWEQGVILSDASQLEPEVQPTEVKELDATKRFPWWVIPIAFAILVSFLSALGGILFIILQRDVDKLGPVDEGQEKYEYEDSFTEKVDMGLFKGVEQAFDVFIMRPNIAAAEWPPLEKTDKWDKNLMEWVTRSEQIHGRGWKFWEQLDNAAEDYATVLVELREAGLPDVLAALPFQESRYNSTARDPLLCAFGYWQFQPEVAKRGGVEVASCKFRGVETLWTPTRLAPPINVAKNAEYVKDGFCQIEKCAIDERSDLRKSTEGAVKLLGEAFNDKELRASGAVTQITIASHNAGYDNSPYQDGRKNIYNMLHAYRQYRQVQNVDRAPDFIGRNITCVQKGQATGFNDRCGGYLGSVTQHYVPYVIAQHFLAVCYYGANYADKYNAFDQYREFVRGSGYCTEIRVPTREQVQQHGSGK